jgi:hypothetical protein
MPYYKPENSNEENDSRWETKLKYPCREKRLIPSFQSVLFIMKKI